MYAAEIIIRFLDFQYHDVFALSALNIQTEDGDEVSVYRNLSNLVTYNMEKSHKKIKSFNLSLLMTEWKADIKTLVPDYDIILDQIISNRRLIVLRK